MPETTAEVPLLGEPCELTGEDYARILRRIGLSDGEQATPVSAFNSSI